LLKILEKRCPNWRIISELKRIVAQLEEVSARDSKAR
jgi:hypothetical protein